MELLIHHHYERHVLRVLHAQWPDPVLRAFARLNPRISDGSHMAMYDDQTVYVAGLLDFLRDVASATPGP